MSVEFLKRFLLKTAVNIICIIFAVALLFFIEPFIINFYDKSFNAQQTNKNISDDLYNSPEFVWIEPDIPWKYTINNFPHIEQGEDYPTGCESVSTAMVLNYFGYDISVDEFIDDYLPKEDLYVEGEGDNEIIYAADPNEAFIGDPYDEFSLGCYAPVIANALENCRYEDYEVINASGSELCQLLREYILNDIPVIFWATMDMEESREGITWTVIDTEREFTWISGEHCLVLIGYDNKNYYFSDPSKPENITSYTKELVEKRYRELGEQCVVLKPIN